MGTNCPQALCIKGFRAFLFVPCYGFSEGQNGMKPWPERVYGFLSPVLGTGDKMPDRGQNGDKLSTGLMYQGFRGFLFVPCYGFSEGTKWHEALARAGFRVFVPCFRYRGQNRICKIKKKQGTNVPVLFQCQQIYSCPHIKESNEKQNSYDCNYNACIFHDMPVLF